MKIKEEFILRKVAGQTVVIPAGNELNLNLMITLNDTGAFLWEHLQTESDEASLVSALLKEYDVDAATAKASVAKFVETLKNYNLLT